MMSRINGRPVLGRKMQTSNLFQNVNIVRARSCPETSYTDGHIMQLITENSVIMLFKTSTSLADYENIRLSTASKAAILCIIMIYPTIQVLCMEHAPEGAVPHRNVLIPVSVSCYVVRQLIYNLNQ